MINLPEYRELAIIENPHCGTIEARLPTTGPAFSVSLCAAFRVLPCLRSLLHSLRASCAFRPKPAFFVRFALFNRGSFAFCAPFCSVRLSSFLSAFCDCAFSFSLLVIFSASPAPPARRFAVFPPWERTMPNRFYRGVAQLVERVVWDHQAAGSNPVTPTKQGLEPIRAPGSFLICAEGHAKKLISFGGPLTISSVHNGFPF